MTLLVTKTFVMSATRPLHLHVLPNFSRKKRIMKGLPLSFLFSHSWRHVFFVPKLKLLPKWLSRFQNFIIRTCECELWVMSNVKTFKKTWIYALAISENNIASLWVHIKFSDMNWRKLPFEYYGKPFHIRVWETQYTISLRNPKKRNSKAKL